MQDLIKAILECRSRSQQLADALAQKHSICSEQAPISALNKLHNTFTLTAEICSHYQREWSNITIEDAALRERAISQNQERVILILNLAAVHGISIVEHVSKEALKTYGNVIRVDWSKRLYWGWVTGKSHATGLMDHGDYHGWDAVIELRDCWIHNNGISERTLSIQLPDGPVIEMDENIMVRTTLVKSCGILSWIVEAYARWCDAFLTRALAAP